MNFTYFYKKLLTQNILQINPQISYSLNELHLLNLSLGRASEIQEKYLHISLTFFTMGLFEPPSAHEWKEAQKD